MLTYSTPFWVTSSWLVLIEVVDLALGALSTGAISAAPQSGRSGSSVAILVVGVDGGHGDPPSLRVSDRHKSNLISHRKKVPRQ